MTSIFISYSRKDIDFAQKIVNALAENDLDTWVDWQSIPKGEDWKQEIDRGIEAAEIFIFLMSPDSARSEICNQEIAHAIKNSKRIIPIVIRDTNPKEFAFENSKKEISRRNWAFCRDQSTELTKAVQEILKTVHTDYEWLKYHTKLQNRALEWERSGAEKSLLVRGKELDDAEFQLATNTSKEPHPTDLQRGYVFKSRQATDQQRRSTFGTAIVGVIALAALAVFGFIQAGLATEQANQRATAQANAEFESLQRATAQAIAEEKAKIAQAKELAAQSVSLQERNFQNSLLLGIEGFNLLDDAQTRGALLDGIRANPQLSQIIAGHSDPINCLALSPDGQILASGSDDNTIILWDLRTNKPIGQPLVGHSDTVLSLAFSPDGKTLASGGQDNKIFLWDVNTRHSIGLPLTEHSSRVTTVAYSPNGKFIASGSWDGKIILWDASSLQPIGEPLVSEEEGFVISLAISQDSKTIAAVTYNSTSLVYAVTLPPYVTIWDLTTQEYYRRPLIQLQEKVDNILSPYGPVVSVAFSPDGKTLVAGAEQGAILWNFKIGNTNGKPLAGNSNSAKLALSLDGNILATASEEGTIILWDVKTGQTIGESLKGHSGAVNSMVFNPDGKMLISGGQDGSIFLWNISNASNDNVVTNYPIGESLTSELSSNFSMAFSPDGKTLASGNIFDISFWDVTAHPPEQQLSAENVRLGEVHSVTFSPDGETFASADDKDIILWDATTREPIMEPFTGHTETVNSIAFSPDSKILASASEDGTIILLDAITQQTIGEPTAGYSGPVNSIAFSPDGKILATGDDEDAITLWDVSNPNSVKVVDIYATGKSITGHSGPVNSIAFSPDGRILASGSDDKLIILWDIATGQPIGHPLVGHTEKITGVAFSPDGNILASVSFDRNIILWDVKSGIPIGQPIRGESILYGVTFSPDGKSLVTGGASDLVSIWDIDPQSWINKACQRAGRNFTLNEWEQYFPGEEYRVTCLQWPARE